ncbi:MAG: DHHA1 domain-containing protein [Spirochaetota bacterium]
MTDPLYYTNQYQRDFKARLQAIDKTERGWEAVLDKTCFYPEGGGQPADRGTLNGIHLLAVWKDQSGIIHHVLEKKIDGPEVEGIIDWEWRFDYMQQHTGQHIISASLIQAGKYNTVSVHQGADYTTIETDVSEISGEHLTQIEELSNRAIGRNLPIRYHWVDKSELYNIDLRRPPQKEGTLRIVEIEGLDRAACGGLHTATTGEVGLVKLIGTEKIRGHSRLIWKIGKRAYNDYREKTFIINSLIDRLSVQQPEILDRSRQMEDDLRQNKLMLRGLESRVAGLLGDSLVREAEKAGACKVVTRVFENESPSLFRGIAEYLVSLDNIAAALVNQQESSFQWIIGISYPLEFPFRALQKALLGPISGKGGGRSPFWQGAGQNCRGIDEFLRLFRNAIEKIV